jgi:hypothetical protein
MKKGGRAAAGISIAGRALDDRPFNQLRNDVWSQLGQIALYEILVREGPRGARLREERRQRAVMAANAPTVARRLFRSRQD